MTHAQKIVRFTFWVNNYFLGVIIILLWGHSPNWLGPVVGVVTAVALWYTVWYLQKRLGVKKVCGLYFVDDEREKQLH
ncbi:hypothetical protein [Levilactobacillus huananensis]|uniref:hypothetical protein n=1 Tax=Levilactobacillus huananensis TaxID=2486019 RepID=UPI000F7AFF80|nr:hypothetical protein [Levilactobacillus huananensis]